MLFKIRQTLPLIACFILFSSQPLQAKESSHVKKIDQELKGCLDKSGGVTANIRDCYGVAYTKMDKRLNELYKNLYQNFSPELQEKLKNAQKKWLDFKSAEQDLAFALSPNEGGTLQLIEGDEFSYQFLKKRVIDLETYKEN